MDGRMAKLTVYQKSYKNLSNKEKKIWEVAYATLMKGGRLYGMSQSDTTHLGWAIGLIVDLIKKDTLAHSEYEHGAVFDLVQDANGLGVRWYQLGRENADGTVLEEQVEQGE